MQSPSWGVVGGIAIVLGAILRSGLQADEPPVAPVFDAARTAEERARDVAAYREHVLSIRMRLVHEHLGEWIAVAGGRAFPVNSHGTMVEPAAKMEDAIAAAAAAVPDARHRFVFRVGEDGDSEEFVGGTEIHHVLGNAFMANLERRGVPLDFSGPMAYVKGNTRTPLKVKGPDARPFVRPEVGAPGGASTAKEDYVLSTGYTGYCVLSSKTAAAAALHLWEIPGTLTLRGAWLRGPCLRSRARVKFTDTDLDFLVPVAVWPEAS